MSITITPPPITKPLDMEGKRIYNLGAPVDDNDAARKIDVAGAGVSVLTLTDTTEYSTTSTTDVTVKTFTLSSLPANAIPIMMTCQCEGRTTAGGYMFTVSIVVSDGSFLGARNCCIGSWRDNKTTYTTSPVAQILPVHATPGNFSAGYWCGAYTTDQPYLAITPSLMGNPLQIARGIFAMLTNNAYVYIFLRADSGTAYVRNITLKIYYLTR
jgi:hypothetical protein